MATRAPLTEAERAQRRARERELTAQAVEQLRTSAGWQAWVRVRARTGLRRYSLHNQLLIALQDPAATRVAGFRAWLALGYCVRKGQTCRIRVWARCQLQETAAGLARRRRRRGREAQELLPHGGGLRHVIS